jgi:hypothetical protein
MKQKHQNLRQSVEGQHNILESKTRSFLSKYHFGQEKLNSHEHIKPPEVHAGSWTNNINSPHYQSRPFAIPPSQDPHILSEIAKAVALSATSRNSKSMSNSPSTPKSGRLSQEVSFTKSSSSPSLSRSPSRYSESPVLSPIRTSGIIWEQRSSPKTISPVRPASSRTRTKSPVSYRSTTSKSTPNTPTNRSSFDSSSRRQPSPSYWIPPLKVNETIPDF